MKLRILLINPWVYDFAAYNLWARPLGLLKVAEYLSAFETDLSLIDCTDALTERYYGAGRYRAEEVEKPPLLRLIPRTYKRYGMSIDEFVERVKNFMPFDVVLISSLMTYWYPGVHKAVECVRELAGDVPIALGGLYPTIYHEHAAQTSGADFIYKGPVNRSLNFALRTFGYRLRRKGEAIPYYRLKLYERYPFGPILTSQGCPFRCSYCASSLLAEKYERRTPSDVLTEITDLRHLGVRDFAFYDDALLVDSVHYFKPLLKNISEAGIDVRFHTPNGLHARFIDEGTARLMKVANFKTIRLSLETLNEARQKDSDDKVSAGDIERAVNHLKHEGFSKKEVGVYLMYGLPGQSLHEVKEGVRFLMGLDVRINLTEFSPIRGTRSWDEIVRRNVIDDDLDPLLTNNTLFHLLYSGYDRQETEAMKLMVKEHNSGP